MLRALYGPRASILNVLAAISSLVFQLPVMLVLFEYRELRLQAAKEAEAADAPEDGGSAQPSAPSAAVLAADHATAAAVQTSPAFVQPPVLVLSDSYRQAVAPSAAPVPVPAAPQRTLRRTAAKVAWRLLGNPPLVGIVAGLLFSLIVRMAAHEDNFDEILALPLDNFGGEWTRFGLKPHRATPA